MLVVDASVWIDFFNGTPNPACNQLRRLLNDGEVELIVPDRVLFEVLRGFRGERDFRQARQLMASLTNEATGDPELALQAAQHDRALRAAGFTIRSSIDIWLTSFCIRQDYALLHRDRDFDAVERVRGLRVWRH